MNEREGKNANKRDVLLMMMVKNKRTGERRGVGSERGKKRIS